MLRQPIRHSVIAFAVALCPIASLDAQPAVTLRAIDDQFFEVVVSGAEPTETWVIQDSYDGRSWRDLAVVSSRPLRERRSRLAPTRFFRAANKEPLPPQERLQEARAKWAARALTDYFYRYRQFTAFLPIDQLMNVQGGVAVEAVDFNFRDFELRTGQSINDLFVRIETALAEKAERVSVRYHPTLGYPESGYIDYSALIADEEWLFEILSPPTAPLQALAQARQRWQQRGPSAYRFDLLYQSARRTAEGPVGIDNGTPTFLGGGAPIGDDLMRPVEQYFDAIEEGLRREGANNIFSVAFDPELGYPTVISDNWWQTVVDGGQRFWLANLRDWSPANLNR